MTETVWLSLGSNMGDRQYYLRQAIARLAAHPLIEVAAVSSLYETDPWGVSGQDDYFNIAAGVATQLEPEDLLDYTQGIEQAMGRRRTVRWGAAAAGYRFDFVRQAAAGHPAAADSASAFPRADVCPASAV